ncbi:MAG: hypothetical protein PHH83_04915 [Patescibacteria group bacterium]|nr:hypothetical protein [Patescibacteria group bacterium]
MEPLYRVVLKKAWNITKKNPVLWIFGFFAVFLWTGGELQMFLDTITTVGDIKNLSGDFFIKLTTLLTFFSGPLTAQIFLLKVLIFILVVVFSLVFLWIVIVSEIAIIKSTIELDDKVKPKFSKFIKDANKSLFTVLGLHIISKILINILIIGISLPLLIFIVRSSISYRLPIAIVVWVIFLPIAIIISFIFKYAINFVVLRGEKLWKSIGSAWILFKTNWIISIEMAIWILFINTAVGLLVLLITRMMIGPFDILTIYLLSGGISEFFFIKVLPLFLLYILVGSIISVFQISSWTLVFDKITTAKRYSKLVRLIASMSSYMSTKNQISKVSDVDKPVIETPKVIKKRRIGRPKVK